MSSLAYLQAKQNDPFFIHEQRLTPKGNCPASIKDGERTSTQMKIEVLLPKEDGIIVRNLKDGSHYFISVLIKVSIHKPNPNI